jgi:hypothetical protein
MADGVDMLRSIVGDGVGDETLRALLLRAGGDVSAAANSFFDGGVATLMSSGPPADASGAAPVGAVGDDVLGTLFKTLEDQGRKLAGAPARLRPRACLLGTFCKTFEGAVRKTFEGAVQGRPVTSVARLHVLS